MLPAMVFEELTTPCALVNLEVLERNCSRMADLARRLGVRLRPHVKTHKCVEAARLQVRGHFGGITVSTLAEARFFADAGFDDITYAVPIAPSRLAEAAELAAGACRLHLLIDHPQAVDACEAFATAHGIRLSLFLEVDCGGRRTGVDPERPESLQLAQRIDRSDQLELAGILTHAGHAYACRTREEVQRVAAEERSVMATFAGALREAGVEVAEVSVGSTPTLAVADDLSGVTEARPGNYVFFDAFQTAIGVCGIDDVAFSVLATVIASHPERRQLVVDAGALALSRDPGPVHLDPAFGFGVVLTADGSSRLESARVISLTQEHGIVQLSDPDHVAAHPIGARLRILPNHACLAAALYDRYHVLCDGRVIDEWRPVRGW